MLCLTQIQLYYSIYICKGKLKVSIRDLISNSMSEYGFQKLTNEFLKRLNRIVNMMNYLIHTIMQIINNIMSNPPVPAPI